MSLYGSTDSNANKTKAGIGVATDSQTKTIIYIDETEAALEQNKTVSYTHLTLPTTPYV